MFEIFSRNHINKNDVIFSPAPPPPVNLRHLFQTPSPKMTTSLVNAPWHRYQTSLHQNSGQVSNFAKSKERELPGFLRNVHYIILINNSHFKSHFTCNYAYKPQTLAHDILKTQSRIYMRIFFYLFIFRSSFIHNMDLEKVINPSPSGPLNYKLQTTGLWFACSPWACY